MRPKLLAIFYVIRLFTSGFFSKRLRHSGTSLSAADIAQGWEIKRYPSDFVVIEDNCLFILPDPITYENVPCNDETSNRVDGIKEMSYVNSELDCRNILSKEQIDSLNSMSGDEWERESVILEITPCLSKEQRTLFHRKFIRNEFPDLDSKTQTSNSSVYTKILVHRKDLKSIEFGEAGDARKSKSKRKALVQRWDNDKPDYLHFTLQKSKMTTDEALELLAKRTGVLPTRFGVCGSKDRYSVTAQRVSAWRLEKNKLEEYIDETHQRKLDGRPIQVALCDILESPGPLSLGNLRGNVFAMRLRPKRDSPAPIDSLKMQTFLSSVLVLQENGVSQGVPFLNLFGPQRFGNPLPVNMAVGKAILQEDYMKAVLLLLLCPGSTLESKFLGSEGALDTLGSWFSPESAEARIICVRDHWTAHSTAVLAGISAERHEDGSREKEIRSLMHRLEFMSALLGAASSEEHGKLETPKSFPFAQRRLSDHLIKQLHIGRVEAGKHQNQIEQTDRIENEHARTSRVTVEELARLDYRKAFSQSLPRNLRLLFVNAFQSGMFNKQARERMMSTHCEVNGYTDASYITTDFARVGDIVLVDETGTALTAWGAVERNVSMIASSIPCADTELSKVKINSTSVDEDVTSENRVYLHIVNEEDHKQGKYGLEHVIVPLPGHSTIVSDEIKGQIINDGCAALLQGSHKDSMFRLPGTYRHIISHARNFRVARGSLTYPPRLTESPEDQGQGGKVGLGLQSGSFSEAVEIGFLDGTLGSMIQSLRKMSEGSKEREDTEDIVEIFFSLCASSYATSFVSSLLASAHSDDL